MHRPQIGELFCALVLCASVMGWPEQSSAGLVVWGDNLYGQTNIPAGLTDVVAIAGSGSHNVALQRDGTAAAWGWNSYGQASVPNNLNNVVAISAGGSHSLALKADGTVAAWGLNLYRQCEVSNLSGIVAVAGGGTHSLGLKTNGAVIAWGNNDYGQCLVPPGLKYVVAVAAGGWHSLALKPDGRVVAWGYNGYGQTNVPVDLTNAVAIAAGAVHSAALRSDGTVKVWGNEDYGQVNVPAGLSNVVAIASGAYHLLALKADGTVVAWGYNFSGQTDVPPGLTDVVAVSDRSLALAGEGAPFLTAPLVDTTAVTGRTVQFRASATGAWPLRYQWFWNGGALPGETNAVLSIANVQSANAGYYAVRISNACGSITSAPALLSVEQVLVSVYNLTQSMWLRGTIALHAIIDGTSPTNLQWQFQGTALVDDARISGARSANLTVTNLLYSDSGEYRLLLSGTFGMATSEVALLVVTNRAPIITQQPQSATIDAGDYVEFAVGVDSPYPLWAQWFQDGVDLQMNSTALQLLDVQTNRAGQYWCVLSNIDGVVTSAVATLTVVPHPPSIIQDPLSRTNYEGRLLDLRVFADGSPPLSYQWFKDGQVLPNGTNAIYSVNYITTNQSGNYYVVITNLYGAVTSSVASYIVRILPPQILDQPSSLTNYDWGEDVEFFISTSGKELVYQWQFNGVDIPGATNYALVIMAITTNNTGFYQVRISNSSGSVTSAIVTLIVLMRPPIITQEPQDHTFGIGSSVWFDVFADGAKPLFYQWLFSGSPIPGATNMSLHLPSVTLSQAGGYQVVVSNLFGVTNSRVAMLIVPTYPPTITQQPISLTNVEWGTDATFSVAASGTEPLFYQWRHNGVDIPGQTAPSLHLAYVTTNDVGDYQCVVQNITGTTNSEIASLTVLVRAPEIIQEPVSTTNSAGSTAQFDVKAVGARPLSYQWLVNGESIAGATNMSLTLAAISMQQQGNYQAVVSNFVGVVTSQVATLTVVLVPPMITQEPWDNTTDWGTWVTFWVGVSGSPPLYYQWQHEGVDIPGATNEVFYIPYVTTNDNGGYRVLISNSLSQVTSRVALLTILTHAPSILIQPTDQSVDAGGNVCFDAGANGAPGPALQWLFEGQPIPGATNVHLCLTEVSSNNAGGYQLVASNFVGSATSQLARLEVVYRPPVFVSSPSSLSVWADTPAQFGCIVNGGPPPVLQWLFNGEPIAGATLAFYSFTASSTNQTGDYSVVASNVFGVVTSAVAHLTVMTSRPVFFRQPANRGVVAGHTLELAAAGWGSPAPIYQWYHNGQPIPGATNVIYMIPQTTTNDGGNYFISAANEAGSTNSLTATVIVSASGPLDRWQWRRPLPQGNDLQDVTFANGVFLAAGNGGARILSGDKGVTWYDHGQGDANIYRLAWGNGLFVAAGYQYFGSTLYYFCQTSSDGIQWTNGEVHVLSADAFQHLAFGRGKFFGVTTAGIVLVSSNGMSWSTNENLANNSIERLSFQEGQFVALNSPYMDSSNNYLRTLLTSADGVTWSNFSTTLPGYASDVAYGGGIYVALAPHYYFYQQPALLYSRDGASWTPAEIPSCYPSSIAYGNGRFVAVAGIATGVSATSTDGIHWQLGSMPITNWFSNVSYGAGQFVAVGDKGVIVTSSNGLSWMVRSPGSQVNLRGITRGGGKYVAVGNDGLLLTSSNSVDWTRQAVPTTANVRSVAWGAGRFIAVGDLSTNWGLILRSTNGDNWMPLNRFFGYSFYTLAYGVGRFVAAGSDGAIISSADGLDWTMHSSGTGARFNAMTFNGSRFVVVGREGTILTSTNGTQWALCRSGSSDFLQGVAFGNGQFLASGQNGFFLTSSNAIDWVVRYDELLQSHSIEDVQFANGVFVVVGNNGFMATSPDGTIWTPRRTGSRNTLRCSLYAEGRLITVGNNETIVQSDFFGPPIVRVRRVGPEGFEFSISAETGFDYRLQGSDDLRNWDDIFIFRNTSVTTLYLDPDADLNRQRFYRVVLP